MPLAYRVGTHRVGTLGLVFALLLSVGACGGASPAGPSSAAPSGAAAPAATARPAPIEVLYFGSSTGAAAAYAVVSLPPMKMALEQINKTGGINGAELRANTVDSQLNAQLAATNYKNNALKAPAIIQIFSGELGALGPLAKSDKIPLVTIAANVPFVQAGRPYVWSVSPNYIQLSERAMEEWMKAVPSIKQGGRVAVIQATGDSVNPAQSEAAGNYFKKQGLTVSIIEFPPTATDYSSVVTKAKDGNPSAIIVGGNPASGTAVAAELKRQGLGGVPTVLVPNVSTGNFLELLGANGVGVYTYPPFWADDPTAADFVKQYKAETNGVVPAFAAAQVYEMFQQLAAAMRSAHVEQIKELAKQREAIQSALATTSAAGVNGKKMLFGSEGFRAPGGYLLKVGPNQTQSQVAAW